jgi:DNA repair photolyase
MIAPIVPGLNSDEIPALIKAAADEGALAAIYTVIRLNGSIAEVFTDWINKAFPDKASKLLNAIADCHGGKLNDSTWGRRMRGDGNVADSIAQLFRISTNRYLSGRSMPPLRLDRFSPSGGKQLDLF